MMASADLRGPASLAASLRDKRTGAIGLLLDLYGQDIKRIAYAIVRNHADADEIVMDTLVTAWARSNQLRDDNALRAWLLRIGARHALSRRRRARDNTELGERASGAPPLAESVVDRVAVHQALDELPPKIRAVVALHYIAGMTVPQIASVIGTSPNTIKTQLQLGRSRLRAALGASVAESNGE
jgi:RNA polymerase sigma-70 factor (ECF subfamily)